MSKKANGKKKSNLPIIIAVVVFLGFGGAFAYFAYDYYLWWQDGQRSQEQTNVVREIFWEQMHQINHMVTTAQNNNPDQNTLHFDTSPLQNARELTQNPDIVAYLFIEGTGITNVVLQGPDNYFYLHHDMFGDPNVNGSLFVDFRNSPDFSDKNTIIYGHNMNNGTMFHNVRYYTNRYFLDNHPNVKVITDDTVFVYEVFSVFSTRVDFDYIQVFFEDDYEFEELLDEITRRDIHNLGIQVTTDDKMLILSTCTNVTQDTRYVVATRLIQTFNIQ